MTFGETERPMIVELFGLLVGLEEEWTEQGATGGELDLSDFDFDYMDIVDCGAYTGMLGGFEPAVLEETAEYLITRDELGRTMKLMKGRATIPLPTSHPVDGWDSWEKIKPMFAFHESRADMEKARAAAEAQKCGALVTAGIPGAFDMPRQLLGEEMACVMCYEEPGLIADMLKTVCDTTVRTLERVLDAVTIDNLGVHEDMAGKSGPLWGPKQIAELAAPYYRRVWDLVSSRGTRLFSQDSDGDMTPVVGSFMECGVNIMYPCEPAAGMDMVALRRKHCDKLAFKGGVDKFCLRRGRDAILKELEYKLQPSMRRGTVFGVDHRIPNGVPIADYRFYVDTAREILGMPPRRKSIWRSMAF